MDLSLLEISILGLLAVIIALIIVIVHLIRKGVKPTPPNGDLAEVKKLIEGLETKLSAINSSNIPNEVKTMFQDLQAKLQKWEEPHTTGNTIGLEMKAFNIRLSEALSNLEFLTQYFKVQEGINEYGSRIISAYDGFITRIDDEFSALASGQVQGREYVLRSNMLLFALMMARVYVLVFGKPDEIEMVNEYLERAKHL